MEDYRPDQNPWPDSVPWVLPSPNMGWMKNVPAVTAALFFWKEQKSQKARGTVFPLKAFGFPGMNTESILKLMNKSAPEWMKGCILKEEFFQPVFDKFQNQKLAPPFGFTPKKTFL